MLFFAICFDYFWSNGKCTLSNHLSILTMNFIRLYHDLYYFSITRFLRVVVRECFCFAVGKYFIFRFDRLTHSCYSPQVLFIIKQNTKWKTRRFFFLVFIYFYNNSKCSSRCLLFIVVFRMLSRLA